MSRTTNSLCIRTRGLYKRASTQDGELVILADITIDIAHGESVAVVGASGSGKSTLLGLLAGLDSPSEGQVELDGVDLNGLDEDGRAALRAQRVGFVFQSFQLLPSLTALENVMLPLELADCKTAREDAAHHLAQVGLSARHKHYPKQLSGGEQQRVAIARAFAGQPKVLFADEPTGNLDKTNGERIGELLFTLNRVANTTLIVATHDMRLAGHCSRLIELDGGRIAAQ